MLVALFYNAPAALAQPSVSHAQPAAILPAGSTRVVLTGDKLAAPVRLWTSAAADLTVVDVQPQKITLDVTPQQELALGPIGLWVATADGPAVPLSLLVDNLPSGPEQTDNHSPVTAQTIGMSAAVDATSDGKQSDYFRFHADAGQEITFEVLAQCLGSNFDPVVSVLSEETRSLLSIDDDSISPDCRFRKRFEKSGNYLLQVHDNRFTPGGRYRLRLGNFPIIDFAYPAVVQRGTCAEVSFAGTDRSRMATQSVQIVDDPSKNFINLTAHYSSGGSPAWTTLRLASEIQLTESEPNSNTAEANRVDAARGLNGLLEQLGDRDVFKFDGIKDQTWRIAAQTRSLGSPTLLKMIVRNAAGEVISKSNVGDSDEWQFDVKFPADGAYFLEVEDLLHRGGAGHGYHVALGPAAPFSLLLKPDPKSTDRLPMQPTRGAGALDVQVQRVSYEGPIELHFEPAVSGLKILNPIIPAAAKEAKIYVLSDSGWSPQALAAVRCVGKAVDAPQSTCIVSTSALLTQRSPFVPYPPAWQEGLIGLAGVNDQPAFFELTASSNPIAIPRSLADGTFGLQLKRVNAEFKDAVALIHSELPPQWSATAKLDKETVSVSLKHPVGEPGDVQSLKFIWYGVFGGRGQTIESIVPVRLFDPIKVTVAPLPVIKPGETQKVQLEIVRDVLEAQPVIIKCINLPAGVTAPENVTIAATDTKIEVPLTAAAESAIGKVSNVIFTAVTKVGTQEYSAQSAPLELEVAAPPAG